MTVIEGNCNDAVERRTIPFGWGYIRGFARPRYGAGQDEQSENTEQLKDLDQVAQEVIDGSWGNGADRVSRLQKAGYDPDAVQKRVNEMLR
jgi:hypothetical protein